MSNKQDGDNGKGKLGTRLHLDDLAGRAKNPPKSLVPTEIDCYPSFVRYKKIRGRLYYQLVRTVWTKEGPRQKILKHIGTQLPPGVRLGPVDEKTAKKLTEGK